MQFTKKQITVSVQILCMKFLKSFNEEEDKSPFFENFLNINRALDNNQNVNHELEDLT
jgi:hypothetical protein